MFGFKSARWFVRHLTKNDLFLYPHSWVVVVWVYFKVVKVIFKCISIRVKYTCDGQRWFGERWFANTLYKTTLHNNSANISAVVCSFWIHCESVISGVDLTCSHSADFGNDARVEWKYKDLKGSQMYVIFDKKPTGKSIHSLCLCLCLVVARQQMFSDHFDRTLSCDLMTYILNVHNSLEILHKPSSYKTLIFLHRIKKSACPSLFLWFRLKVTFLLSCNTFSYVTLQLFHSTIFQPSDDVRYQSEILQSDP